MMIPLSILKKHLFFHDEQWERESEEDRKKEDYEEKEMDKNFDFAELMIMDLEKDSAFDQPCKYGNRVGGHSVYCHNKKWKDAPRKCRRTWYTGGKTKDKDCKGFKPNIGRKGGR